MQNFVSSDAGLKSCCCLNLERQTLTLSRSVLRCREARTRQQRNFITERLFSLPIQLHSRSGYKKTRRADVKSWKPGLPNQQRGCEMTRARVGCGKSSRRIVWSSVEQETAYQRA